MVLNMKRIILSMMVLLLTMSLMACGENEMEDTVTITSADSISSSENVQTSAKYIVEEVGFEREGMHIYGELYLPEDGEKHPLVVISHGFGGNLRHLSNYAEMFARNGIAACAFDFIGGGSGSRSDGKITEMSVLTESADLNAVIDGLITRDDIDASEIYLLGGSQGGFVSTYVAGTRPTDIKGLIALYPAYVLQDNARSMSPDPDNIPETMNLMGTTIGRIYNKDAMSFDIYDVMKDYPKDVLIIHGTSDNIAPISYSERAVTVFPSAQLVKFEGAGHGFYGDDEARSAQMAVDFVKEHLGNSSTAKSNEMQEINNEDEEPDMRVKVSDGINEVVFMLNDSSAAKSLYSQLPITTEVDNYSSNEKIFYPPEELDDTDVIESDGPLGTLAYFSPWGNVVMYYSECGKYPGLYILGGAIEGEDNIEKLSGTIEVTALKKD